MLHAVSIRHPKLVVAIAVIATLAMAPGILRLRLRTDGHALVPERAPAVVLDRTVRERFDIRDPIVVLVRPAHADGIFNPGTLRLIADLTAAFARLPGLDSSSVRSLATERGDRFAPGTLRHRRLLEPLPQTGAQLDDLRGDLDAIQLLTGTMVSFDGRSAALYVRTPPAADRTELVAAITGAITGTGHAEHGVDVIGAPVAEALLGLHILEDLGVPARGRPGRLLGFLPLSIAVMGLVFLLTFRSLAATLLPLAEAAACLVFVFGLMGWTGVPVYLTMAVLPVILVSMGLADEIHVFSAYRRLRRERPAESAAAIVRAAMDETSLPVIATSLTTAAGFLSFAISSLPPVRAFGIFTAIGILFCLVWTLTAIPALLVLIGPSAPSSDDRARDATGPGAVSPARAGRWSDLAGRIARRPLLPAAVGLAAIALTPIGIARLVVQDSWISGFSPASAFHQATTYFNQHFYGTHRLLIAIDTGVLAREGLLPATDLGFTSLTLPGDLVSDPTTLVGCSLTVAARDDRPMPAGIPRSWGSVVAEAERRDGRIVVSTPPVHGSARFLLMPARDETLRYALRSHRLAVPAVLRGIDSLERFVRAQRASEVGGVLGPADLITTAEFLTSDRDSGSRVIPTYIDRLQWLWRTLAYEQGPERMREWVDPALGQGLVTAFLREANYVGTARLMDTLRAYERRRLAPARIRMEFAGDVAVSQALIEAIVTTQVRSVLLSLLGILALTGLLFRSLRWGLICTLPAAMAVAVTFAVMGWARIPLGVATSMFAGMVLGIGVDFAIHLVQRFRTLAAQGTTREQAVAGALEATGPPIAINALAVSLGFGILTLSRVPANARLGALTAVGLMACLAMTLLVLPVLLRTGRAGGNDRGGSHRATPAPG